MKNFHLEKSTNKLTEDFKIEEESLNKSEKILEKQTSKTKRQKIADNIEKTTDNLAVVEVKYLKCCNLICKKVRLGV